MKLTAPVAVPCPDKPATSDRKYAEVPYGCVPYGKLLPLASMVSSENAVVLPSGETVIGVAAELLGAKVESPA